MSKVSRRSMATYAADQLLAGKPAKAIAEHLTALLIESNRQTEADFLMEDIAWELEQRQVLVSARVTSAHPLSVQLEREVKKLLQTATGSKQVAIQTNIDKSVVGGVRIDTSSKIWDFSVARKLSELREVL